MKSWIRHWEPAVPAPATSAAKPGPARKGEGGMQVEINKADLVDMRKSIIEMMFPKGTILSILRKERKLRFATYSLRTGNFSYPVSHLSQRQDWSVITQREWLWNIIGVSNAGAVWRFEPMTGNGSLCIWTGNGNLVGIDYEQNETLREERKCHEHANRHYYRKGKSFSKPFGQRATWRLTKNYGKNWLNYRAGAVDGRKSITERLFACRAGCYVFTGCGWPTRLTW